MDARVKQSSRYGNITAFSGCEYVKYEWRIVPAGKEEEAARHPYLEVKQIGLDVLESLPEFSAPVTEPVEIVGTLEETAAVFEELPEIKEDEPIVERIAEPVKVPRNKRK